MNQQAGGQDDKNSMAILWIIGSIFVICLVLWMSFKQELVALFLKIRYVEALIIWWCVKFLPDSIPQIFGIKQYAADLLVASQVIKPTNVSLEYASDLSLGVGLYLRFPIIIVLVIFCIMMYGRNVKMRYRKSYDMDSLAAQESAEWPQINPIIGLKINEENLIEGPWAMSLSPVEFCKKFNLMSIAVKLPETALSGEPKFIMHIDKIRTSRLFASQLGRLWRGPEYLPVHKRALFSALIARGCRDTQKSRDLLNQINTSCKGGRLDKIDFSGSDILWKKHINNSAVEDLLGLHAYENTIFMALLLFAREDGVLSTADFIWLKPFDRRFWYVLNSVGRQTPCCEAAGVHAHFLAERALRRPLGVPVVEEATNALSLALEDINYKPESSEGRELVKKAQEKLQVPATGANHG
jgi:intracellular multiplication protein IcmP